MSHPPTVELIGPLHQTSLSFLSHKNRVTLALSFSALCHETYGIMHYSSFHMEILFLSQSMFILSLLSLWNGFQTQSLSLSSWLNMCSTVKEFLKKTDLSSAGSMMKQRVLPVCVSRKAAIMGMESALSEGTTPTPDRMASASWRMTSHSSGWSLALMMLHTTYIWLWWHSTWQTSFGQNVCMVTPPHQHLSSSSLREWKRRRKLRARKKKKEAAAVWFTAPSLPPSLPSIFFFLLSLLPLFLFLLLFTSLGVIFALSSLL